MRGCTRGAVSLSVGRNLLESPRGGLTLTRHCFPLSSPTSPVGFYLRGSPIIRHFTNCPHNPASHPSILMHFAFIIRIISQSRLFPLLTNAPFCQESFYYIFFKERKKKKKTTQRVIDVIPRKRNPRPFQLRALQVKGKKKKIFQEFVAFLRVKTSEDKLVSPWPISSRPWQL